MKNRKPGLSVDQSRTHAKKIVCYTSDIWSSALSEVRLRAPLEAAGFQVIQGNDHQKWLVDDLKDVDFVVVQRDFPQNVNFFFHILEQTQKYRVPLIYEIDDLLFDLPENHPLLQSGVYSARFMPMLTALCKADLVSVSTKPLAKILQSFHTNVQVLPNYLADNYWNFYPIKEVKKTDDNVIIGYVGGHTHTADLKHIENALIAIGQQFGPKVKLNFWGLEPPEILLRNFQVEWQPPIASYRDYALNFNNQEIDIFIAPLEDNTFNQSKSYLKFLEYSTLGIPGVYSKVAPYKEIVKHGKNGFLASSEQEWKECLQALISSPDLRYQLAQNAQETVIKNFLLSDHANEWLSAYENARIESSRLQKLSNERERSQEALLRKIYSLQVSQSENLEIQIETKDRIIRAIQAESAIRQTELEILQAELENKEFIIGSMINSTSWSLTKPLRFISRKGKEVKQILFHGKQ